MEWEHVGLVAKGVVIGLALACYLALWIAYFVEAHR